MKIIVSVAVVSVFVLCAFARPQEEKYTTKYDNIDVKDIINNERLTKSYVSCILEKGPCTKEGETLKEHIADGLSNECAKCSDKQKEGSKYVLKSLIEKYPAEYKELEAKYDPKGDYRKKYEDLAKKHDIPV